MRNGFAYDIMIIILHRKVKTLAYKDRKEAIDYNNKFIAKAYDRINLTVTKGKKETIQAHANSTGESVNGFINRAIDETIQRDTTK